VPRREAEPGIQPLGVAPAPPATFADFEAIADVVVVGKIEQVEPGVGILGGMDIEQRVRVAVSEVLRDEGGSLVPGDELVYLASGGRVRFGERTLYGPEAPGVPVPEVGSRVLLSGSIESAGAAFVNPTTVSPVRGETVKVPEGMWFEEREVSLEKLRLALSRRGGGGSR
jgi:hypothetical protein